MNLKEIRDYVNNLSEEFLEYEVVCSEDGVLDENHNYRLDKPFICLSVDEENKEVLFFVENIKDDDKIKKFDNF